MVPHTRFSATNEKTISNNLAVSPLRHFSLFSFDGTAQTSKLIPSHAQFSGPIVLRLSGIVNHTLTPLNSLSDLKKKGD